MKLHNIITIGLLFILLLATVTTAFASPDLEPDAPDDWQPVGTGIDYRKYHLTKPRPVDIFVARMDRSNLNATIESSIAQGRNSGGTETVQGMASRYHQAINYWDQTWGNRNRVVIAINGYFFNTVENPVGMPWSGQIHSGWYVKRFDDFIGDAGFAWTLNRTAHIGDCVYHKASKQYTSFERDGYTPNIRAINIARDEEELILYTPQYDTTTKTSSTASNPMLEILVEMTRPSMVLPAPAEATGYIREIRDKKGSTPIPFDHVVISAWGNIRETLVDKINAGLISVGDRVGITQEITDCESTTQNNWTKSYAGMAGDYHFLNDGVIRTDFGNPDAYVPNSRTAIAYNSSYIFFVVVDRWNPGVSEGMKIAELADFVKNTLNATDAVTQDSGGSSTMVVNGTVVNNTTCNFTGCVSGPSGSRITDDGNILRLTPGLFLNLSEGLYGVQSDQDADKIEPAVANGMLMVAVDPLYQSASFIPGGYAIPKVNTEVRLGPGTNYGVIGTAVANSPGVFLDHFNLLNGVLAKGSFWWKAQFGSLVGWVKEEALYGGVTPGFEANFSAEPTSGIAPLFVKFTNSSIGDYTESIWDFGDGASSNQTSPSHTYAAGGDYTVSLTIRGPGGENTLIRQNYLTVYEPVVASFSAIPSIGLPPLPVTFTNTSKGDFNKSEVLWDFHDGTTSTNPDPFVRIYPDYGTFQVSLTVKGPGGESTVQSTIAVVDHVYSAFFPLVNR